MRAVSALLWATTTTTTLRADAPLPQRRGDSPGRIGVARTGDLRGRDGAARMGDKIMPFEADIYSNLSPDWDI